MDKKVIALLSGLGAASIWGGMYVVSKVVLEVIPPFALLTLRLALGFLSLAVVIWLRKPNAPLTRKQILQCFLVGVVGYGISLGFQFTGTKLSSASNGALITSATPAFVLAFAFILLREKITGRQILALAISTLGVLAVIDPRTAQLSPSLFSGNLLLFFAGLTWALYSVLVRKTAGNIDLLASSAVMLLGGIPSSAILGFREISAHGIGEITVGIIGGILFLGIISTAIAMFLWNYAFKELPATAASLTFFAQPVVGTLLGWLFLSETITPLFLFGGVLIGIGILISTREYGS
ncbi:MAG: DMT family transporter [Anaerolineales bacterium]|nr:MAG: DMT family transporter [Anaerolineales bacterium]